MTDKKRPSIRASCSFCRKSRTKVAYLLVAHGSAMCDECIVQTTIQLKYQRDVSPWSVGKFTAVRLVLEQLVRQMRVVSTRGQHRGKGKPGSYVATILPARVDRGE